MGTYVAPDYSYLDKRREDAAQLGNEQRKQLLGQYQKVGDNISQALQSGQIFDPTTQQTRPLTPEEKQQLGEASGKVNDYIKNLYNPRFDMSKGIVPGDPVHSFLAKLHIMKPEVKPPAQQKSDLDAIRQKYSPAPGQEEAQKFAAKSAQERQQLAQDEEVMRKAGMSDEEIKEVVRARMGGASAQHPAWKLYKLPETGEKRYFDQNRPDLIPDGAQPVTLGGGTKERFAWVKKNGRVFSVKLDEKNQVVPGTENYDAVPPPSMSGSITEGHYQWTDSDGNIHSSPMTTIRRPLGGGGGNDTPPTGGTTSKKPLGSVGSSATMATPNPKGLKEPGNIPIGNRPTVQNSDGSHSSEYSTSFQDEDGSEVLVPTIVNGKFLTPDGKKPPEGSAEEKAMFQRAWQHYKQTGQHLGKFDNSEDADAYAQVLHNRGTRQAKPPGVQKKELNGIQDKHRGGDRILGFKGTKNYQDAKQTYHTAITRDQIMHDNAEAAHHGNQQAMVSLLMNHIGMTLGLQKGTRVTQTIIDEAQTSDDAWSRMIARLGVGTIFDENSVGGLFPKGVVLDDKQIDQMVELADQRVQVTSQDLNRWEKEAGQPLTPEWKFGQKDAQGEGSGKKRHSLKKAMALRQNQGKSAEEVRNDLRKHGYEVIEDAGK